MPMPPMPPIPPAPAGILGSSSFGFSATIASVVSMSEATDAAFCSAQRLTFAGSMTPALIRSSYSPVAALKPKTSAGLNEISGRNKLLGIITSVRYSGLLAQVTIDVCGQSVTSIITSDACRELNLKKGIAAYALVKATEVMLIRA